MPIWNYRLHQVLLQNQQTIDYSIDHEPSRLGHEGWEAVAWVPDFAQKDRGWVLLKKHGG
jgi:hypothetical protein